MGQVQNIDAADRAASPRKYSVKMPVDGEM